MAGILRKQINRELMSHPKQNENKKSNKENDNCYLNLQYWVVNISQLINCLLENKYLVSMFNKNKRAIVKRYIRC